MFKDLKWIVIPGGPGMSNNYLLDVLPMAFQGYELHFYNTIGSPESAIENAKIDDLVNQITEESEGSNEYGLITHSFGNYLALRLLEKNDNRLKAIIMLNPIPFTFKEWQESLASIVSKVPPNVLHAIAELSKEPDKGNEIFKLIYPYYVAEKSIDLPFDIPFNMNNCNSIASQVETFNDIDLIEHAPIPMCRVVGEQDPFYKNQDVMTDNTIVINDTGHYPFLENHQQFSEIVPNIEEKLCRQTIKTIKLS